MAEVEIVEDAMKKTWAEALAYGILFALAGYGMMTLVGYGMMALVNGCRCAPPP